ncbi:hypothetical protein [Shimia sp. FJ5]|uniref:hypothetical protein n=1 Tax=Shimia sp. FJ5 TaxID=3079054 RepID=UPI0026286B3E|nr:hypothetical protein [Shimia sp. FJ5]MDV4145249.1 hypothetical protein [Shimia sp. FJ5]
MIRWFFLLVLCAGPAFSGPWLRDKGTAFTSTTVEISPADPARSAPFPPPYPIDAYTAVYGEYGLTPRLTLGFDGGSDTYGNGTGLLFLRFPLREGKTARMAGEIALGARWSLTELTPLLRPGASWGRGLTLFDKPGWAALDATVLIPGDGGRMVPKLDATLGLDTGERMKVMLGLTVERPAPTLSASVAFRAWDKVHLTVGIKIRGDRSRPDCLTLGFWQTF